MDEEGEDYVNMDETQVDTGEDYVNMDEAQVDTEMGDDDFRQQRDYLKGNGIMANGGRHSAGYDNMAADSVSQTDSAKSFASPNDEQLSYLKRTSTLTGDSDSFTRAVYGVKASPESIVMTDVSPEQLHQSQEILFDDDDGPNQSMFFTKSDKPLRIDYVLVYDLEEVDPHKEKLRKEFEENLADVGVVFEYEQSSDGQLGCVKIHSPWEALAKGAKLMSLRKRLKLVKEAETVSTAHGCWRSIFPDQDIVPNEEDYYTAPFDTDKLHQFAIDNHDDFFENAERSLITKMFLDNTEYVEEQQGTDGLSDQRFRKGIDGLLSKKVYTAAFPLHEGRIRKNLNDLNFFKGQDKDRLRLYYGWAKPSNVFRFQPLDHVRKYFGEKIGLYFAWLGFYTVMLIPAALFGFAVFLFGLITLKKDAPSNEVCDETGPGGYTICPLCDHLCNFTILSGSCIYARLTYVFDNDATVALAVFMSVWALIFLEFWKREQAALQFLWDVGDYEADEKYRPGYEKNAKHFKINPITEKKEPYIPWYDKFARLFTSASLVFFLMALVVVSIFAVLVYRMAVTAALFATDSTKKNAKLITTVTASVINLAIITILSIVYKWLAIFTTKLEKHKTYTDHEDSYTFKIIVFQFINYYGSILYIAFFKGSFVDPPGRRSMYVFGKYRQDQCDPTGCFIELTIQLFIIMVGKQAINSFVELILPVLKNCFRRINDDMKNRTRWEDDLDLEEHPPFIMFDEYLEMVIQFGFVTLFVAAFPLAPVFALINNVIEIRLDAYKTIKLFRRPVALKAQDIGAWYPILKGFAYIAVITNAFIIGWTSEYIPKMVYKYNRSNEGNDLIGYIDASLSTINTSVLAQFDQMPDNVTFPASVNVTECRFSGYYERTDPPTYEYTKVYWQIFFARMAFVIVFEHTCFLLMSLVAVLIPDVSARIKRMRRYERLLVHRRDFEDTFTGVRDKRQTLTAMFGIGRVAPT